MKFVFILFMVISFMGFSQQRVGFDMSYRQTGLNATISYHAVFAQNWLISGAVNFGGKGRYSADYRDYSNTSIISSPWDKINQPVLEENLEHPLKRYNVTNSAISVQIGLGYFHNFDVKHGLRGHVYAQCGKAFNAIVGYYENANARPILRSNETNHSIAAVSAELYHTIHLWKKITFFYGLKTPYYFRVDKSLFNPVRKEDHFYGLEPELSLGITFLIGDC